MSIPESQAALLQHMAPHGRAPRARRALPPITSDLPPGALVRVAQIIGDAKSDPPLPALLPMSKSSFYALVRKGRLPPPVKLPGSSSSLWRLGELRSALAELTAGGQP